MLPEGGRALSEREGAAAQGCPPGHASVDGGKRGFDETSRRSVPDEELVRGDLALVYCSDQVGQGETGILAAAHGHTRGILGTEICATIEV